MIWRVPVFLFAAGTLSGLACARVSTSAKADGSVPPVIERVVPASGQAGTAYPLRVTIEGRHFADSGNTVTFATIAVSGLPATDGGTRIVVFLPKEKPSSGEVPPAVLQAGIYKITVKTSAGESNAVDFELKPEPGALR
jgi:IPT/TIG domain-containing protein